MAPASAVQAGCLVDGDALDERREDARLADALPAVIEQVPVQHREVRRPVDGEDARLLA
jgi:hypothetical protein